MDADLIASVIVVESGGNSKAISPTGACGLMQIQARDTSTYKRWLFVDRPTCKELQNPYFNVGWGVHYLATLYHKWGDDWREALFHYGPERVGYSYADMVLGLMAQSKN